MFKFAIQFSKFPDNVSGDKTILLVEWHDQSGNPIVKELDTILKVRGMGFSSVLADPLDRVRLFVAYRDKSVVDPDGAGRNIRVYNTIPPEKYVYYYDAMKGEPLSKIFKSPHNKCAFFPDDYQERYLTYTVRLKDYRGEIDGGITINYYIYTD